MSTITLSPQLTSELKQAAAAQSAKPEELLEDAVRAYLRQLERDKIKTEAEAFRQMHAELAKQYLGQYVAIHNGQLVDHDVDFQKLHQRVPQTYGRQAILLRRVTTDPERVLVMRSPRLNRDSP
jgi:predicted transcriptional regulator